MGRLNNDTNVAGPSIALLQERFRQLEKAREQREDKTLKLFPEPEVMNISTKNCIPANKQGLQHDQIVIFPSEKDHLSLGLSLNNSKQTGQTRCTRHFALTQAPGKGCTPGCDVYSLP
uniref:Uncharacterized protein n=1 Tax=Nicotiana tabacum TaxID=4097 RepID=A0A1S4B3H2_TOBAC|nr:PREDICTED: uncharacterized protein LOC107804085 [Nicotiana tabacum]